MFDVSFSELFVIAVVALLVIGPEKLPKVARTVGAFVGRMQRYVAQVKEEVNREARFEELQKLQQEIKQSVENNVVKPIEHEADALKASIHKPSGDAKKNTQASTAKKAVKMVANKPAKTKSSKSKVSKAKPA
jgi:sec-independent protein translocase protein TatB